MEGEYLITQHDLLRLYLIIVLIFSAFFNTPPKMHANLRWSWLILLVIMWIRSCKFTRSNFPSLRFLKLRSWAILHCLVNLAPSASFVWQQNMKDETFVVKVNKNIYFWESTFKNNKSVLKTVPQFAMLSLKYWFTSCQYDFVWKV